MAFPPPKPAWGLPAGPDGPFGTGGRAGGLTPAVLTGVFESGFFSSVTFVLLWISYCHDY